MLPYWEEEISPALRLNKTVLIVAHGNTLRALVKYLDGISNEKITEVNIPTGVPIEYQLNDCARPGGSVALVWRRAHMNVCALKGEIPLPKTKHESQDTVHQGGYQEILHLLQIELVKLQSHIIKADDKILVLLEGRDSAGKDGVIKRIVQHLSPRETRVVARSPRP